jgi:hypothetical protein
VIPFVGCLPERKQITDFLLDQVLCYDFVHIASEARLDKQRNRGTAAGGFKSSLYPYLLVLLDRFSRKVRLHPSARADGEQL